MNAVVISLQRCSSGGEINVNPQRAIVSQHTHQHTGEKRIPMTPRSSSLFVCKDCGKSVFFKAVIYRTSIQMCEHSVSRLYFIPASCAGLYILVAGTHTSSICTPDKGGVYAATVKTCSLWCSYMANDWVLLLCLCSPNFKMEEASSPLSLAVNPPIKEQKYWWYRPLSLLWQTSVISGETTGARFHLYSRVLQYLGPAARLPAVAS